MYWGSLPVDGLAVWRVIPNIVFPDVTVRSIQRLILYINLGFSYSQTRIGNLKKGLDAYLQTMKDVVTNGRL